MIYMAITQMVKWENGHKGVQRNVKNESADGENIGGCSWINSSRWSFCDWVCFDHAEASVICRVRRI